MKQKQITEPPMQGRLGENDVPHGRGPSAKPLAWCLGLAMAAWALHLFVGYSLVEWYCRSPVAMTQTAVKSILLVLTAACFLTAAASALGSMKYKRKIARRPLRDSGRTSFFARFGVLLCMFLAVLVVAQTLPIVMVATCI